MPEAEGIGATENTCAIAGLRGSVPKIGNPRVPLNSARIGLRSTLVLLTLPCGALNARIRPAVSIR